MLKTHKKYFCIALCLLLQPVSLFSQTNTEEDPLIVKQQLLDRAIDEMVELKKEKQALEESLNLTQKKYQTLIQGFDHLREGRKYDAALELKKIAQWDPKDKNVLINIGILLSELKLYGEASTLFYQVVDLDPTNANMYANLGFVFAQSQDHKGAVPLYQKAIELDPHFAIAHYNLALSYLYLKDQTQAVEHLEKAAQLFPEDSPWQKTVKEKLKKYSK